MEVDENVILQVSPPPLSKPLNPAHQLMQGTQLIVWVQAIATGGGVPTTGSADIEVQPIYWMKSKEILTNTAAIILVFGMASASRH